MLCAVLKKKGSPRFAPLVKNFGSTSVRSFGVSRRILSEDRWGNWVRGCANSKAWQKECTSGPLNNDRNHDHNRRSALEEDLICNRANPGRSEGKGHNTDFFPYSAGSGISSVGSSSLISNSSISTSMLAASEASSSDEQSRTSAILFT